MADKEKASSSPPGGISVSLLELVLAIASTVDLISSEVHNHHVRVAYSSFELGQRQGLSDDQLTDLLLAAALHDIGALTLRERLETFAFEFENPHRHAELGYRLLKQFPPFRRVANIVRYHHAPWMQHTEAGEKKQKVPFSSHIIHLADRFDVLARSAGGNGMQMVTILDQIKPHAGERFSPDLVEDLRKLAERESFQLDLESTHLDRYLLLHAPGSDRRLDTEAMLGLTRMLSTIIDFQSRFTATHSSGVAAVAERLAELAGYNEQKLMHFRIAGYLHDLGKIAISDEILEKPAALDDRQKVVIRAHSYYTLRLLEQIEGFGELAKWAAYHHERLDGTGYPFHVNQQYLSPEARLMAVADIFTALTEDRPYREGMSPMQALSYMRKLVEQGALDLWAVELVASNGRDLDEVRERAQKEALSRYEAFQADMD